MLYTVVGISQRRSGTSTKNGKPYDFTAIQCTCPAADVTGLKVEEVSFSHLANLVLPDVAVGDTISVDYDKRGFMVGISLAEKSAKNTIRINATQS